MSAIHLGISTCPNDTFAFHGILTGQTVAGLEFEIELLDVEELNRRLLAGDFDVAKVSFHAALAMSDEIVVLPVGAALGHGVGPLLLARPGVDPAAAIEGRVLCPGAHTTATLLYHLFHRGAGHLEQVVFSAIMPALTAGEADYGVCIHEGRFTYREHGLVHVEDLGDTWQRRTGQPLPLGGIVARRGLGDRRLAAVTQAIRSSLALATAAPDEALPTMRRHAQEMTDTVLRQHVELYVNDRTTDLGQTGTDALRALSERAHAAGLLPPTSRGLELYTP